MVGVRVRRDLPKVQVGQEVEDEGVEQVELEVVVGVVEVAATPGEFPLFFS